MGLALSLGRRGQGQVWPNPAVGCVLVRDDRIVGRGWTQPGGRPHAEVVALAQAGPLAKDATAYVTLEPCAHIGQTPPCAQALIDAQVARVVVALKDDDPRVNGQGIDMLRAAGVKVNTGCRAEEAARDHAGFLLKVNENRPFISLKLATSFDGRIATATGESQWITGPKARRLVHAQRATHDAVMIGAGTARADDPSLTVRDLGIARQPVRIVVSRRLDLPLTGKLARTAKDIPLWLCHGKDAPAELTSAWRDLGATLIECPLVGRQINPPALLQALATRGLTRIFCEGGGTLAASLLQADLVDQLIGFTAGLALGAEGQPGLGAMGVDRLAEAPRFALTRTRQIGPDTLHIWHRA
ncbi:MAG: bifunctional diaminohydroxyphosphoribosylaminopyrimidine deaminase/5-amino-6-(5-phosphoribosylamino)uracil reductase RibD [Pseudomonadota bacterium]